MSIGALVRCIYNHYTDHPSSLISIRVILAYEPLANAC
jgi:hypothetical protein